MLINCLVLIFVYCSSLVWKKLFKFAINFHKFRYSKNFQKNQVLICSGFCFLYALYTLIVIYKVWNFDYPVLSSILNFLLFARFCESSRRTCDQKLLQLPS